MLCTWIWITFPFVAGLVDAGSVKKDAYTSARGMYILKEKANIGFKIHLVMIMKYNNKKNSSLPANVSVLTLILL